jgi:hypothetical protein
MPRLRGKGSAAAGILFLFAGCSTLLCQNPQLQTKNGRRFPTIVFVYVAWSDNPAFYSVAVDSTGAATYQSAPDTVDRTGVPYTLMFQTNEATRRTIFGIGRDLNFFDGNFPLSMASPQKSAVRSLAYHDITFSRQITYTESSAPEIEELTSIFEEISNTLEFGRKLTYLHQHDRSKLDDQLTAMEKDAEHHLLREVQVVTPVLRGIASDEKVSADARQKSEAILDVVRKP